MRLSPGVFLGPYEILTPLAAGGMGEVYRARDPRLGREVAIKVLPEARSADPERLRRFRQEARAAGRLNHPNVLTVYDIGESEQPGGSVLFLVTELLEGETLRARLDHGALEPRRALELALQICRGLAAAHGQGILHRDLKPENLFLTTEGRLKILDFGLAKLTLFGADGADLTTVAEADATRSGVVLGTIGYMSPEQVRGEAVDARGDVFALGTVLYEMLTGRRAFARATAAETLAAILRDEPGEPPAASSGLEQDLWRLTRRCLAKEPRRRFEDARDVESALESLAPSAGIKETAASSLAVLPFRELGGEALNPHLSVGLADAIITELAAQRMLIVRPTSAILRFRDGLTGPAAAARELGVDAIVEGAFQRAGDRLRVTVQLVAAREERPLWGTKIDTTLDDVFRMQDEISRRVTQALTGELAASGVTAARAPSGPAAGPTGFAYELYLKGRLHLLTESLDDTRLAVDYLRQATVADPGFALAWAGLADAYVSMSVEFEPEGEWWARGRAACERALALDPDLPEGRYIRARLLWSTEGRFDHGAALRELAFAVARRPSLNEAFHRLGTLLCHVSLLEVSGRAFERSVAINPEDSGSRMILGFCRYLQGRTVEALRISSEVGRAARSWLWYQTALCHVQLEHWEEARSAVQQGARDFPQAVLFDPLLALFAARRGDGQAAHEHIAATKRNQRAFNHYHHAQYDCACAYAALGEIDNAIEWVRAAARNGFPCVDFMRRDRLLDPLRREPTFERLLQELDVEKERYARLVVELDLPAALSS